VNSARCKQVVERSFDSWNDPEKNRRYRQMKLVADVPPDYESEKKTRPNANKRKRTSMSPQSVHIKPKRPKSKAIKCKLVLMFLLLESVVFFSITGANGCKKEISGEDPNQREAIQCCHQNDDFDWIDEGESCSRWLCNGCRIKLGISTEGFWFCSDHAEMHSEEESESKEDDE